jgi:hypothetical protein
MAKRTFQSRREVGRTVPDLPSTSHPKTLEDVQQCSISCTGKFKEVSLSTMEETASRVLDSELLKATNLSTYSE